MKVFLLGIITLILFSGCDATLSTKVKMSELYSSDEKVLNGLLRIQIPSCNQYEDSRKESKTLFDLKSKMPYILPGSQFTQCFRESIKSYAEFSTPVQLSKNKNRSNEHIGIFADESNLLSVYVPKKIQDNIKQLQDNSIIKVNLKIKLQLINDLGKSSPEFMAFSTYINDDPIVVGNKIWLKKDSSPTLTLSDVTVSSALNKSYAMVLLKQ